jgi:hypothetical protein
MLQRQVCGNMTKNKESTRYFSDLHEKSVCKLLDAQQQSNSGAGNFRKGDVIQRPASMLIECKTVTTDKDSVSIKKEWIEKNIQERFTQRLSNSAIAFNFGPNQSNYFVIDSKLMRFLIEKLAEENK